MVFLVVLFISQHERILGIMYRIKAGVQLQKSLVLNIYYILLIFFVKLEICSKVLSRKCWPELHFLYFPILFSYSQVLCKFAFLYQLAFDQHQCPHLCPQNWTMQINCFAEKLFGKVWDLIRISSKKYYYWY